MENKMRYRALGSSGIQASVVGLGTFAIGGWFYGGADEKDSIAAIHASIDCGVNLIDTAPIYGYGLSEEIVGKAIRGKRDKIILATKAGLVWTSKEGEFSFYADEESPTNGPARYEVYRNLKPASLNREIELSLKRLGTDYIDLYQTHWQDATTPVEITMEALEKLKSQGKIRAIGVSNVTVDHLKRYGNIASAQEKYSLIDRGIIEKGIVDYCMRHGIAILSYFTMEQGLLTGTMNPEREFKPGDMRKNDPRFKPDNIRAINALLTTFKPFADKYSCTVAQLIIALTLSHDGITHALIGARNAEQAKENALGGYITLEKQDAELMNSKIGEYLKSIPRK